MLAWLVLCACSREQAGAADAAADARSAPSVPRPQPEPLVAPSQRPAPSSDLVDRENPWERCRTGYAPRGEPTRDVLQLGLMCGPSTGMRPLEAAGEGKAPSEVSRHWDAKTGECFRVVVAGEPDVRLVVAWTTNAPHQGQGDPARLVSDRGNAWLAPGAAALCMSAPGEVALRLETRGSGRYAYQIFKRR
ncbi:MAG: hypothetical protein KC766_13695 [Myxococcales bacterium]|nr:hypothetical protein [Myxococcales bacterium]